MKGEQCMKKMLILVAIVSLVAGFVFAEEAILIDFGKLEADFVLKMSEDDENEKPNQNKQTMMDFSRVRYGGSFTEEQKKVMKTSLAIANWEVTLSSSSRTVNGMVHSYTREAKSDKFGTVMGVRINFPLANFSGTAVIKPPFEIPAYEFSEVDDEGNLTESEESEDGAAKSSRFEAPSDDEGNVDNTQPAYGVVKNVGTIKAVAANVYGLNFPHALSIILIDSEGKRRSVNMGYLNFDGWAELRWDNPQYIQEVRNRDLRLYPLYPTSTPFVKFGGFEVRRDGARAGGDFIAYFKDVKILFDKAVLDTKRDIDDEGLWQIINSREEARKVWEMERFGHNQVLRYLDAQKQAPADQDFTPTPEANE
jgi:hypothetical protein